MLSKEVVLVHHVPAGVDSLTTTPPLPLPPLPLPLYQAAAVLVVRHTLYSCLVVLLLGVAVALIASIGARVSSATALCFPANHNLVVIVDGAAMAPTTATTKVSTTISIMRRIRLASRRVYRHVLTRVRRLLSPPLLAESVIIVGLLCALLQGSGCSGGNIGIGSGRSRSTRTIEENINRSSSFSFNSVLALFTATPTPAAGLVTTMARRIVAVLLTQQHDVIASPLVRGIQQAVSAAVGAMRVYAAYLPNSSSSFTSFASFISSHTAAVIDAVIGVDGSINRSSMTSSIAHDSSYDLLPLSPLEAVSAWVSALIAVLFLLVVVGEELPRWWRLLMNKKMKEKEKRKHPTINRNKQSNAEMKQQQQQQQRQSLKKDDTGCSSRSRKKEGGIPPPPSAPSSSSSSSFTSPGHSVRGSIGASCAWMNDFSLCRGILMLVTLLCILHVDFVKDSALDADADAGGGGGEGGTQEEIGKAVRDDYVDDDQDHVLQKKGDFLPAFSWRVPVATSSSSSLWSPQEQQKGEEKGEGEREDDDSNQQQLLRQQQHLILQHYFKHFDVQSVYRGGKGDGGDGGSKYDKGSSSSSSSNSSSSCSSSYSFSLYLKSIGSGIVSLMDVGAAVAVVAAGVAASRRVSGWGSAGPAHAPIVLPTTTSKRRSIADATKSNLGKGTSKQHTDTTNEDGDTDASPSSHSSTVLKRALDEVVPSVDGRRTLIQPAADWQALPFPEPPFLTRIFFFFFLSFASNSAKQKDDDDDDDNTMTGTSMHARVSAKGRTVWHWLTRQSGMLFAIGCIRWLVLQDLSFLFSPSSSSHHQQQGPSSSSSSSTTTAAQTAVASTAPSAPIRYSYDVFEYGIDWNFFLSLALVPVVYGLYNGVVVRGIVAVIEGAEDSVRQASAFFVRHCCFSNVMSSSCRFKNAKHRTVPEDVNSLRRGGIRRRRDDNNVNSEGKEVLNGHPLTTGDSTRPTAPQQQQQEVGPGGRKVLGPALRQSHAWRSVLLLVLYQCLLLAPYGYKDDESYRAHFNANQLQQQRGHYHRDNILSEGGNVSDENRTPFFRARHNVAAFVLLAPEERRLCRCQEHPPFQERKRLRPELVERDATNSISSSSQSSSSLSSSGPFVCMTMIAMLVNDFWARNAEGILSTVFGFTALFSLGIDVGRRLMFASSSSSSAYPQRATLARTALVLSAAFLFLVTVVFVLVLDHHQLQQHRHSLVPSPSTADHGGFIDTDTRKQADEEAQSCHHYQLHQQNHHHQQAALVLWNVAAAVLPSRRLCNPSFCLFAALFTVVVGWIVALCPGVRNSTAAHLLWKAQQTRRSSSKERDGDEEDATVVASATTSAIADQNEGGDGKEKNLYNNRLKQSLLTHTALPEESDATAAYLHNLGDVDRAADQDSIHQSHNNSTSSGQSQYSCDHHHHRRHRAVSGVLAAIAKSQFPIFILANLLTGMINILLRHTRSIPPLLAGERRQPLDAAIVLTNRSAGTTVRSPSSLDLLAIAILFLYGVYICILAWRLRFFPISSATLFFR